MQKHLSVVTYNIYNGKNPQAILKNIARLAGQNVSVFCIQEMRQYVNKDFLLDQLLQALGPDWSAEHLIDPGTNHLGLCTLWNKRVLQAKSFESLLLPKLPKLYLYERAVEKFINRTPPRPVQRAAIVGDFVFEGEPLRITNVHLDWHGGFKQRRRQLEHIAFSLKTKLNISRQIFCGDFNTIGFYRFSNRRSKKISNVLGSGFKDAFSNKNTTSYLQMLDHIFVKNISVIQSKVLKLKGSDHFPLLAEVRI